MDAMAQIQVAAKILPAIAARMEADIHIVSNIMTRNMAHISAAALVLVYMVDTM